ncbi:hypothetical protein BC941DRAFT_513022 [Chlamydoabsidia padenii]|nr:hypothetical protein BC941DRAFT_513022 [Chlamydoabsidia padenii]
MATHFMGKVALMGSSLFLTSHFYGGDTTTGEKILSWETIVGGLSLDDYADSIQLIQHNQQTTGSMRLVNDSSIANTVLEWCAWES